jgi:uracil-DNA glycosylase family 4
VTSDPKTRKLAAEYFRQMMESGEEEIFLAPECARAVKGGAPAPARAAGARAGTRRKASAGEERPAPEPGPGAADAAAKARAKDAAASEPQARSVSTADLPAPEIVRVKLAFSESSSTADMFSANTGVEDCSSLEDVEAVALKCEKCELAGGRTKVVFGVGNASARLMFVGEAPGRDEDIQGVPFVGRAGQLLNKILEAAEIERDDVYIANIIKCRPPNNRTPLTNEIEACIPYLGRQVEFIRPRVICTLGLPATQTLLGIRGSMGSLRGKIYTDGDVKVIPTYHPAAALRDPKYKRPIWDDFQMVKREYERE